MHKVYRARYDFTFAVSVGREDCERIGKIGTYTVRCQEEISGAREENHIQDFSGKESNNETCEWSSVCVCVCVCLCVCVCVRVCV